MREVTPRAAVIVGFMGQADETDDLRQRQQLQERAERQQLAESDTEAEAERHRRRADKAGYLREKLEERERSEREAGVRPAEPPED